jgi:DNA polymerase-4
VVEDIGIDEVYADVSILEEESEVIARRLKAVVYEATGLTCSVGIAPNKLLAKLSSDMQKPDGFTILNMADVPSKIWPMRALKVNGVGPKANAKLASLGIATIGDVAACDQTWLIEHFGRSYGAWLHKVSHGLDERLVVTDSEPVSMSRETTFEQNLHAVRDRDELRAVFSRLCEQVAADLQRKGYVGRTVGVKLRFDDFKTVTRDLTPPNPIGDVQALRRAAVKCLKRVELDRPIRLLGIRASGLLRSKASEMEESAQIGFRFD